MRTVMDRARSLVTTLRWPSTAFGIVYIFFWYMLATGAIDITSIPKILLWYPYLVRMIVVSIAVLLSIDVPEMLSAVIMVLPFWIGDLLLHRLITAKPTS